MCIHTKKYQTGVVLTSNPPKYPWVCEKCGERGYDIGEEDLEFKHFRKEFRSNKLHNFPKTQTTR